MCGIAGIIYLNPKANVTEEMLRPMTSAITYRGPDDEGYYTNHNIGLGFRRLSIIDLELGHQPISNGDNSIWTVFNGEIYNFRELRERLVGFGHKFVTHSDSEVLVHLYEHYGPRCVDHLRGMFAFAIYDKKRDSLFLARDRFGKKPLYFAKTDSQFVFGSELKVVMAAGGVSKEVNPKAVSTYFTYGYVTGGGSIFKSIEKCPPAHHMQLDCTSGELNVQRYWEPRFETDYTKTEADWKQEIREKLSEAVKGRMISDVPLGAFLSGGIDSSIVVATMAQLSEQPVKTFSIGFVEQEFNELQFAGEVAKKYKTDHHEHILEPESVDLLPKLVHSFDEPFSDPSAIPTYYVSKFAKEHVTVCLSGDGGDELFAGYNHYPKQLAIDKYNRLPTRLNQLLWGGVHRSLPDRMPGKGLTYFLSQNRRDMPAFFSHFTKYDRNRLFSQNFSETLGKLATPETIKQDLLSKCDAQDLLSRLQYLDISTWMVDDVLCKVDRMSMLNSLEVRCPLLDHEFAEMAFQIPTNFRISGDSKKYILKEATSDMLPANVLSHRKQGFGVPLKVWFRSDLKEYINDRLGGANHRLAEYLDMDYVQKVVRDHNAGLRDLNRKVWSILVFDAWLECYG